MMKFKWLANVLLTLGIAIICLTAGAQAYYAYRQYAMFKDMESYVIDTSSLYSEPTSDKSGSLTLSSDEPSRPSDGNVPLSVPLEPDPESSTASPPSAEQQPGNSAPNQLTKQSKKSGLALLGTIEILKIDIRMMMFEGAEPTQLAVGVGHITETALPGQIGNCSVAGHRSGSGAKPFEHLNQLENGDIVKFTVGDNTYEYEVFDKFIVEPTDTWVLKQDKQDSIATIITCEYVSITVKKRLIVQARLIVP